MYLSRALEQVIDLFYPHLCAGCSTNLHSKHSTLCFQCIHDLPVTNFHLNPGNPVEKIFWGRMDVAAATSYCYFTKGSLVQHILHQFKYKGNKAVALALGRMLGESLVESGRFDQVDCIVPLPLHPKKEKLRGYNQAALLADGISEVTGWPVSKDAVKKRSFTNTQTHKTRTDRWQNMKEGFVSSGADHLVGKHFLLTDDVVTTGATLEACGAELLRISNTSISIATLAYAIK